MITGEDIRKIIDLRRIYEHIKSREAYFTEGRANNLGISIDDEAIAQKINELIKARSDIKTNVP